MQRKFTRHIQGLKNGDKWQRLKALKPSSIHHEKYTLVGQQKNMQIIYQNEPMNRERQFKFYPPSPRNAVQLNGLNTTIRSLWGLNKLSVIRNVCTMEVTAKKSYLSFRTNFLTFLAWPAENFPYPTERNSAVKKVQHMSKYTGRWPWQLLSLNFSTGSIGRYD